MSEQNYTIAERYTLPSHGLIYDEDINPEIKIRSMTVRDEMRRLAPVTDGTIYRNMAEIIDNCLVEKPGISCYDMCLGDYQFLLFKLRTVTYGPEYEMGGRCPYCGTENYIDVDLDNLEIMEYSDDLAEMLEMTLPESGNVVTLTLQTPRTLDKITRMVTDRKRRTRNNEDPTLIYTITNSITEVDGESKNPIEIENWIRDLPMKDTNSLLNRITEVNNKIGVNVDIEDICVGCGRYYTAPFHINSEFFRPSNQ